MNEKEKESEEFIDSDSEDILVSHYNTLHQQDEVDDLKYRISQLENLVVSSTILNPCTIPSIPSTTRLTPNAVIQRVSQLESLLAASEFDSQRLEKELENVKVSTASQVWELNRLIHERNLQIRDLEQEVELLNIKLSKSSNNMKNMEKYLNTLPAQQELDEVKHALSKYEIENDVLQEKVDRLEISLDEVQKKLTKKEILYNSALLRLEELQPLEIAQNSFLQRQEELHEISETNFLELAKMQKAQLVRCGKIIQSQRKKLCDFESERAELILRLSEKENNLTSLQENLKSFQLQIENFKSQLKFSENEKCQLEKQVQCLCARVDGNEKLIAIRRNEMSNLIRLIIEVEASVQQLNQLVQFCQCISSGEEPSADDILGDLYSEIENECSETDKNNPNSGTVTNEFLSGSSSEGDFDVDVEWILERIKMVRDFRRATNNMRSQVTEIYSDILSSDTSGCAVQ